MVVARDGRRRFSSSALGRGRDRLLLLARTIIASARSAMVSRGSGSSVAGQEVVMVGFPFGLMARGLGLVYGQGLGSSSLQIPGRFGESVPHP